MEQMRKLDESELPHKLDYDRAHWNNLAALLSDGSIVQVSFAEICSTGKRSSIHKAIHNALRRRGLRVSIQIPRGGDVAYIRKVGA
jgi:hypothetical protein